MIEFLKDLFHFTQCEKLFIWFFVCTALGGGTVAYIDYAIQKKYAYLKEKSHSKGYREGYQKGIEDTLEQLEQKGWLI